MMFLGECTQKKNHFALCSKTNKTRKKSKSSLSSIFSLFPLLFSFLSFLSIVSSQQKTSSLSKSCSRFHHLKRKTHLSSLRAQFRAHTSSRAETHHRARKRDILLSVVLCSFNTTIKSVLREKRERRERVVCG